MENVRCKCGKIVCQLENQAVLIKCRHCKRYIALDFDRSEEKSKPISGENRYPKIEYR